MVGRTSKKRPQSVVELLAAQSALQRHKAVSAWRSGIGEARSAAWTARLLAGRISTARLATLSSGQQVVSHLSFDNYGALLAACAADGLRVYDLDDVGFHEPLIRYPLPSPSGSAWSLQDDSELALCLEYDDDVLAIDLPSAVELKKSALKRRLRAPEGHSGVRYVAAGGRELVVACGRTKLRAWAGAVKCWQLDVCSPDGFATWGDHLVAVAASERVKVWDANRFEVRDFGSSRVPALLWAKPIRALDLTVCDSLTDSRDGSKRLLVVAGRKMSAGECAVVVLDATDAQILSTFRFQSWMPACIAPFCKRAISAAIVCASDQCGRNVLDVCRLRQLKTEIGSDAS